MAKINLRNKQNQKHGFWNILGYVSHYINDIQAGYYEGLGSIHYQGYRKNGRIFGVYLWNSSLFPEQVFYKQVQRFGERLDWKPLEQITK